MGEFDGRVMVVSGAANGVGRSTLAAWRRLGGIGAGLDIADSDDQAVLHCDVTAESEVAAAISTVLDQHGRLDALVHCSGMLGPSGPLDKLEYQDWRRVLDVNATGGYLLAKHALNPMARNGGGAIVFTASIVAENGSAANPAYAAAKAALVNLGLSLAAAVARRQIRVNVVSPGSIVGTNFLRASRGSSITLNELAHLVQGIPAGRAATADDVASVICFLLSPSARHINGSVLTVDGGERLPLRPADVDYPNPPRGGGKIEPRSAGH